MAKRTRPCVMCGSMDAAMCFAGESYCSDLCRKELLKEGLRSEAEARVEAERRREVEGNWAKAESPCTCETRGIGLPRWHHRCPVHGTKGETPVEDLRIGEVGGIRGLMKPPYRGGGW